MGSGLLRYSQSALLALHNRLGRDFAFATFSNERRRGRRYNYACTGQSLAGTPRAIMARLEQASHSPIKPRPHSPFQPSSNLSSFHQTRNKFLPVCLRLFICAYIRLIFALPSCGCSLARLVRRPVPIAVALVAEQRALQPYPYRCTSPDSPHHAWTHLLF